MAQVHPATTTEILLSQILAELRAINAQLGREIVVDGLVATGEDVALRTVSPAPQGEPERPKKRGK